MKRFLTDILLTLLLGVLIVLPVEVWLAKEPSALARQYDYLENNPSDIKTLILGHSQTAAGLDARELGDSAINLSYSGRIIYFDRLILEKYINRMDNLRTVVYPMHYSFSGAMRFFAGGGGKASFLYDYRHQMHLFPWRYAAEGLLSYSQFLSGLVGINQLDFGEKQSSSVEKEETYGFAPLTGHADWRNEYDLIQTRQDDFEEDLMAMAKLCAERDVRFVVIVCPFTDEALAKVTEAGRQNMQDVIDRTRTQYPVEYHNYLADEQFRHDTALFYDWSHLNSEGAKVFTQRVKEDLGL